MTFSNYTIRQLSMQDIDAYFQLVEQNRARLEDFFTGTVSRTKTFEDTKIFLADITQRAQDRSYYPYIILDTTTNKIAGFIDLKNIDWNIPKSEMGMYIDKEYANKGIASEAFCIFCNFCFEAFNFQKLFLRTHQQNTFARRVAEKCGFEIEGTIRRDYKTTSGELVDLIYYGKIKE
ncbi:MAG: GNAT family N-acetyltransferase [Bacteroidetes bacterium]|nr:GNAT family N-acetyltransferase [Bacteroidota bacterium]MBP6314844.1 GNAT family N-acetyltransferase [Chitinophagaceae bacterium]